ncbi:MAG: KEOPS complex subunit Pcc1 [Halodesulfurarchaeum sp.]
MHETTLSLSYSTPAAAALISRALRPEIGAIADDRSRTAVDRQGATLALAISAEDPVALRAAQNTWLGLVEVAEDAIEIAEGD